MLEVFCCCLSYAFIQKGDNKLMKTDSKDIYIVKKHFYYKINVVPLSIHQRILKKIYITVSTKILISTTVFNMDNKK